MMRPQGKFVIDWVQRDTKSRARPDPNYPNGMVVRIVNPGVMQTCQLDLPYPAPSPGTHMITCQLCGLKVAITAAGRPDDPKLAIVGCLTVI